MDERKRSLRKEIVRLALPIALQQFMTALVGACDAIMLGKLSQDAQRRHTHRPMAVLA